MGTSKKYRLVRKVKKAFFALIQCWYVSWAVFNHLYRYPGDNGEYKVSISTTMSGTGFLVPKKGN
jgi:hypothetical protein